MSAALARYAETISELTRSERLVLVTMARVCSDKRLCWMSNAKLSELTGYTVRQVRRAKRGLEARGLIVWDEKRLRTRRYAVLASVLVDDVLLTRQGDAMSGGEDTMSPDLEFKDQDLSPPVAPPTPSRRRSGPSAPAGAPRSRAKTFEELDQALDEMMAECIADEEAARERGEQDNPGATPRHAGVEGVHRRLGAQVDAGDGRRAASAVDERAGRRRG